MNFEKMRVPEEVFKKVEEAQLKRAIEMGILKPGSKAEELTIDVRQEMLDRYTLQDAIGKGLLKEGSTTKDLTMGIKGEVVKRNGGPYIFRGAEIVAGRKEMGRGMGEEREEEMREF